MQYITGYIMLLSLALIGSIIIGSYYFSITDGPSEYVYDAEHDRLVSNESDEKNRPDVKDKIERWQHM